MKRVVFFVLFFFVLANARSQNLVVNPGLETWETSTKPAGWTTATKCSTEATSVHTGSYSCLHAGSASSRGDLGQSIAVTPGKSYNLSFFYKTGITTTGVGARLWCYWKDAGGGSITDAASDDILRSTTYLSAPDWTQHSVTVTAPATAASLYLEVRTYINSITYWDDFVFEESVPTGISDAAETTPEIYPVPAEDYLIIRNAYGIKSIELHDLSGSKLISVTDAGDGEIRLYVGDLRRGVYVLRIHYGVKVVFRKFLKS